tara:strand:+ start:2433 stop:2846 length:414 start_codon:yes stop_codon:yes gene_type:complete
MLNNLYETSPDQKIKPRTQVSYSLERTVNKAFRNTFMTWVEMDENDDIVKPYRRFTSGRVLEADMILLKEFFNAQADEVIAEKKKAIKYIEDNFKHDFDKDHFFADPKLLCKFMQQAIDQCEDARKTVNEILSLQIS